MSTENLYPGYEEIGRCNPELFYICDSCGADEFAFNENGESQGWNRMFRKDGKDLCEYCVRVDMEKKWSTQPLSDTTIFKIMKL